MTYHLPVLLKPILEGLSWTSPISLADFTLGGGGHLSALLEHHSVLPKRILAVDQDVDALKAAHKKLEPWGDRIKFIHSNFEKITSKKFGRFDRLLVDLGVSSYQLDTPERGFSFRQDGPLDMRMNATEGEPAWAWLAQCGEKELADVLFYYGEEKRSRKLARKWVQEGQKLDIQRVKPFVEFFGHDLEARDRSGKHPLTRMFQAIRIQINREMEVLEVFLKNLPDLLELGGRAGIITFHSLEDRAVKWGLKGRLKPINKKVIQADRLETKENPRSRSAKLRLYEKTE